MTRKDYELIADLLAKVVFQRTKTNGGYKTIVLIFANTLARENPRFNADRFTEACQVDPDSS